MANARITRPIKNFTQTYTFPTAITANYGYSGSIGYNDPGHSPESIGSYSGSYDLRRFAFLIAKDGDDYIARATSTSFSVTIPVTDGTTSGSWSTIINPGVSEVAMEQLLTVVVSGSILPAIIQAYKDLGYSNSAANEASEIVTEVVYDTTTHQA